MTDVDLDTGVEHISPFGLEHHTRQKLGLGGWFATLKFRHFIIKLHQDAFPELAERMKQDPANATRIYGAFLAMIPLQIKGTLTADLKTKIMRTFNL